MLKGFKDFIMRGNVVDLAVAVVIGAAFKAVVDALVADIITPILAAIGGKPDFRTLYFTINGSKFFYGDLINQIISFLIVAAAIYFLIVVPLNAMAERGARGALLTARWPSRRRRPRMSCCSSRSATCSRPSRVRQRRSESLVVRRPLAAIPVVVAAGLTADRRPSRRRARHGWSQAAPARRRGAGGRAGFGSRGAFTNTVCASS